MGVKILVFSLVLLGVATGGSSKSVKIVGGENSAVSEFPHLVSLRLPRKNNTHYCAGSIISRWHFLTAAHCVQGKGRDAPEDVHVYTGCDLLRAASTPTHRIDHIRVHPRFTGSKTRRSMYEYDVAVVSLREAVQFNECQNKIELPSADTRGPVRAVVSGWGLVSYPEEKHPQQLQKASTLVVENAECSKLVSFAIGSGQMCAVNGPGVGACKGDSGSGLVAEGKLIGVASFVQPCATGRPDVYTRVFTYLEFINWIIS